MDEKPKLCNGFVESKGGGYFCDRCAFYANENFASVTYSGVAYTHFSEGMKHNVVRANEQRATRDRSWFFSRREVVEWSPVVTTTLIELANTSQIARMYHTWSSRDQSIVAWSLVGVALWLWLNYYRVMLPRSRAFYMQWVGIALNHAVIAMAIYLRWFGR